MLWYKAWRESRTRFAIIASALAGFCLFAVLLHHQIQSGVTNPIRSLRGNSYSEHIDRLIYSGTAKGMFALLTIFLGLGGLLREKRHRTASFTLALPVSRLRILVTQMAVGIVELAILSLLPALLIPSSSLLVHQYYPLAEALHFSILWFCCGSGIFAAAFLLSVLLGGEYTAPVACYVALMLEVLISNWPSLRPYRLNLMWTMGEFGTMHWNPEHNLLLAGPLPWPRLLTIMAIALCMLALAARITQKQDY
ncbi:MAG TPA: hypothetical protein VH325_06360 [Bryobacteraceae bacterium]|jgi:ABC-type transport system involved in multi-copper enzyme maturation permease subunit|nr:hypothetical protein [Bryobacteraceae bacterium]